MGFSFFKAVCENSQYYTLTRWLNSSQSLQCLHDAINFHFKKSIMWTNQNSAFFFKSKNFLGIFGIFLACPSILAFARAHIAHAHVNICVPTCETCEVFVWMHGICHSIQCICHYLVLPKLCNYALKCANFCTKYMLFAGLLGYCLFEAGFLQENMAILLVVWMAGMWDNIWGEIAQILQNALCMCVQNVVSIC